MQKRAVLALLLTLAFLITACGGAAPAQPQAGSTAPSPTVTKPSVVASGAPATPQPAAAAPATQTAGQPKTGGTLRLGMSAAPPTIDATTTTATASIIIGMHIFESLVNYDGGYQVAPMLAETIQISPDGKVFTFPLRKGIKFHNGKEMTAEDVIASFERWRTLSPRKSDAADLETIEQVDPYTVRMTFKAPQAGFLASIASFSGGFAVMPKELTSADAKSLKEYIGTGPFKFVEWIPDRHVKLERNTEYSARKEPKSGAAGDRTPYVDTLLFIPVPQSPTRVAGIEGNQYDFAEQLPTVEYDRLTKNQELATIKIEPQGRLSSFFNHTKAPFDSQKMRQAVLAAVNPDEVMKAAAEDDRFYRLDASLTYKETPWHSDVSKELYNQNNPAKAKQLAQEAGYKGEELILLTTRDYENHYRAAVVFKDQMEKAGFNFKLEVYDWPTVLKRRSDAALWNIFFTTGGFVPDPVRLAQNLHGAAKYPGWYNNATMNTLLDEGRRELDTAKRKAIYEKAQKLFYEDVAYIKYGDYHGLEAVRANVKGYVRHDNPYFWGVWLDK